VNEPLGWGTLRSDSHSQGSREPGGRESRCLKRWPEARPARQSCVRQGKAQDCPGAGSESRGREQWVGVTSRVQRPELLQCPL
jgi:hypothetical protein